MATNPLDDISDRSARRTLALALLKHAGAPNPSLGGALLNGLSMGIMGMIEGQDEKNALQLAKGGFEASAALPMPSATPQTSPSKVDIPSAAIPAQSTPTPSNLFDSTPTKQQGGIQPNISKGGIDRSSLAPQ